MLRKSSSDKDVGYNIAVEEAAGKPRAQAIAIALNTQRTARRKLRGIAPRGKHASS